MKPTQEVPAGRLLRTESEYDAAVAEINRLFDLEPTPGSPEADRLDLLTLLVGAYDEEHYPMPVKASTPQDVVAFLLEQNGMTRAQLAAPFGGRSRVSEFFSGVRDLSTGQVQELRAMFNVSADLLLPPPHVAKPARSAKLAKLRQLSRSGTYTVKERASLTATPQRGAMKPAAKAVTKTTEKAAAKKTGWTVRSGRKK